MSTADYSIFTDFAVPPGRDAVDGFAAIAAALDEGMVTRHRPSGQKLLDILAIVGGWAVLVTVVLHPEAQLAAIGLCGGVMVARAAFRGVFGMKQSSFL